MKRVLFLTAALLCLGASAFAQQRPAPEMPEFTFTTVKANPITSIKNQASSGTCWSFSAISFLESEAIRLGNIKDEAKYPDFSEFYVVSNSYKERAEKYIRLDGKLGFSAGSGCGDVLDVVRNHGIVPNEVMTGMNYGTELPQQAEMDAVLAGYVGAAVKIPNRTLTTAWKRGFDAVVDEYLGEAPETFTVDGKTYTPASYRDAMKINADDYIELTSFTHHPFYTWFALEVCDNWRWSQSYNVPIDELMAVLDNALENGYTVCWGADVSHDGFNRQGLGILVDAAATLAAGSDQEHWVGKEEGRPAPITKIVEAVPTQESRQKEFDNKTMTDDHGMHIYGIARDQDGKKYYMVKNSWGETGKYKGIWYCTEAFVKAQTLDITIHKDALTKDLKKRLNVK